MIKNLFVYDFLFYVLQTMFKYRQIAIIFVGVMPLSELRILEIYSFVLFFYMLWHTSIELNCIWRFFLFTLDQVQVSSICLNWHIEL